MLFFGLNVDQSRFCGFVSYLECENRLAVSLYMKSVDPIDILLLGFLCILLIGRIGVHQIAKAHQLSLICNNRSKFNLMYFRILKPSSSEGFTV